MVRASLKLPQFSLRWLLIGVVFLGAGCAAVASVSHAWDLALQMLFHLLLPVSLILAVSSVRQRRAFWTGVAIMNLWCHVACVQGDFLIPGSLKGEVRSFLESRFAEPLIRLRQDRVDYLTEQRIRENQAWIAERQATFTPAQISAFKADLARQGGNRARELVASSLWSLMLVCFSITGGCLAQVAYACRGSQNVAPPALCQGSSRNA